MTALNPCSRSARRSSRALRAARTACDGTREARARAIELLRAGRHPRRRRAARRLPAPVLRRHAPARDDRDGARLPARAADRRRADDRARRHDPGADPGAARRAAARARHGDRADHPRPRRRRRDRRPRGGDVRRPDRRDRRRSAELFRDPAHPYTLGLLRSIPQLDEPDAARCAPIDGQRPELVEPPPRLPPSRRAARYATDALPRRDAAARRGRPGPQAALHPTACELARARAADTTPTSAARGRRPDASTIPIGRRSLVGAEHGAVHAPSTASSFDDRARARRSASSARSGCGKSTLGRADPAPASSRPRASVALRRHRRDRRSAGASLRALRRRMQIVFQDPYASLNPRMTVGDIVAEPLRVHGGSPGAGTERASAPSCSSAVGLRRAHARPLPARVLRRPAAAHRHRPGAGAQARLHRLRRAGLGARRLDPGADHQPAADLQARARPDLPVHRARPRRSCATSATGSRSCISAGSSSWPRRGSLLQRPAPPLHAGAALGRAAASITAPAAADQRSTGDLPSPLSPPSGCVFHTRCPYAMAVCREVAPRAIRLGPDHVTACHLHDRDQPMRAQAAQPVILEGDAVARGRRRPSSRRTWPRPYAPRCAIGSQRVASSFGARRSTAGSTPSVTSPSARRRPHSTSCVASPKASASPRTSCSPICISASSPISRPRTAARPGRSRAPKTGRSWSRTATSGASTGSCSGSFAIAIPPGAGARCCAWARSAARAPTRAA